MKEKTYKKMRALHGELQVECSKEIVEKVFDYMDRGLTEIDAIGILESVKLMMSDTFNEEARAAMRADALSSFLGSIFEGEEE